MKFAIAVEGDQVAQHFGRCERYEIVDVGSNGEINHRTSLPNSGHAPGKLPRLLQDAGAQCVLAGGIGPRAVVLFEEFDIKPVSGVRGDLEDVVRQIASGSLEAGEDLCEHH